MPLESLTATKPLAADITSSPKWLEEAQDRLLGFETLRAFVLAERGVVQMEPDIIAEKTLSDKGLPYRIIRKISANASIVQKLKKHD